MLSLKYRIPSREDWVASLVVFVVALPLSLGIALASGAGLSALVFQLVQEHGIQGLAVITVVAGLFQVGLSLARAGKSGGFR